jgi:predicted dinucleotide-binding enzyme
VRNRGTVVSHAAFQYLRRVSSRARPRALSCRRPRGATVRCTKGARIGTFAEAADFGEVVALATLWSGTPSAIMLAGRECLRGKALIDVTNPLVFHESGPPTLAVGHTDSGGEQVQRLLPESRVVKAFNIVGNPHFYKPDFPGGPPTMFYCGNDADAKKTVAQILVDFGWESADIGGIEGARLLEPMCILWVEYGFRNETWDHAFKMLRK